MEEETLKILLSGPSLSDILCENINIKNDHEGFLLGEIFEARTKTITDMHREKIKVETFVKINSAISCPKYMYFIENSNRVDTAKLKDFLGAAHSKVVAWFRFRPFQANNLLHSEKVIHEQLTEIFHKSKNSFSCCLLYKTQTDNKSTGIYQQNFLRYHNNKYVNIPIHIENLSDLNNQYIKKQHYSVEFSKQLTSIGPAPAKTTECQYAVNIQEHIGKEINNKIKELTKYEYLLGNIKNEVEQLRKSVHEEKIKYYLRQAPDVKVVQDLINFSDDEESSDDSNSTSNSDINALNVNKNNSKKEGSTSLTVIKNDLRSSIETIDAVTPRKSLRKIFQ